MKIQLPDYAALLFQPKRYKILYGGRGSGKSYSIARALLLIGAQRKIRVLCAREFQNSIKESVHFLLMQEIDALGLGHLYNCTNTTITGTNGTEFIFQGIRMNVNSIKSMAGITHVWIEEAQTISQFSWDILVPTIREPGSEIWASFNPLDDDDPIYVEFVTKEGKPKERDDAYIAFVNYTDNPWFPDVLGHEKDRLYKEDPDRADHVWGGQVRRNSEAQIFRGKWTVREFEPESHMDGPYFGADFGFSVDPSTLVRLFIDTDKREILIRNAKFGEHIEIDDMPEFYDQVPDVRRYLIRADKARPETISYIGRQGFLIEGADKWTGSVEDGIEWLRSFKIVIHPECDKMIAEAKNYSYKVDRLTGDILTDVVDAHNHGWDAVRYACQPMIAAGNLGLLSAL